MERIHRQKTYKRCKRLSVTARYLLSLHQVWYWSSEGVKRYIADNTLGSIEWFDLDLWTCDLKNNRDHLLIEVNPCTKLGIDQVKGSNDIERTTFGLQNDIPTDRPTYICKTMCPLFQGGGGYKNDHISLIVTAIKWLKYCQYGVNIYPINKSKLLSTQTLHQVWQKTFPLVENSRPKTSFNQSINQISCVCWAVYGLLENYQAVAQNWFIMKWLQKQNKISPTFITELTSVSRNTLYTRVVFDVTITIFRTQQGAILPVTSRCGTT